eukprot:4071111-Alexandrium_andersonii.AAC.1
MVCSAAPLPLVPEEVEVNEARQHRLRFMYLRAVSMIDSAQRRSLFKHKWQHSQRSTLTLLNTAACSNPSGSTQGG